MPFANTRRQWRGNDARYLRAMLKIITEMRNRDDRNQLLAAAKGQTPFLFAPLAAADPIWSAMALLANRCVTCKAARI